MSTIAERLKQIRKNKGMTQAELGEFLGVTKQAIANVECGKNNPSIDMIYRLIEILSINANWFITGKGDVYNKVSLEFTPETEKAFNDFLKRKGLL